MTIIFGTLGFTPKKLLPTVTRHPDVKKLVFFHDKEPRSQRAAEDVRRFCHERRLTVEGKEVNAFDILECAAQMRSEIRKYSAGEIVFNLTGGTPVISSAAILVCILEGVRAVYIHETTHDEISLPLLTIRYDAILNEKQRRVLRFVARRGEKGCTQAEIARTLKLAPATVSHHVKNLRAQQLLKTVPNPEDTRRETLFIQPSAVLLLEDVA